MKQQSFSEYLAFVAFIGLAAVLLGSSSLELSFQSAAHGPGQWLGQDAVLEDSQVQQQRQQQQQQHATATFASHPAAPVGTPEAPERFQKLRNRPALALRNEHSSYPQIRWPQYSGQQLQPPSQAELQNNSGEPVNGSNPYMLVVYNGSFFGKQWPTHA
jgi:hypothetical protein